MSKDRQHSEEVSAGIEERLGQLLEASYRRIRDEMLSLLKDDLDQFQLMEAFAKVVSEHGQELSKQLSDKPVILDESESGLFEEINKVFSDEKRARWNELIEKRNYSTISEPELADLIALGDEMESLNVKRFAAIDDLAQLRGVNFSDLCNELEIKPS